MNKTTQMKWLLKREYWEHRGGIFWAPIIAAIFHVGSSILALIAGIFISKKIKVDSHGDIPNLNSLIEQMKNPDHAADVSAGIQSAFMMLGSFPMFVVILVMFFYCLSSLYDDRKDRSILFWKSMPISDGTTVLSKVLTVLFVIPTVGTIVSIITGLAMFIIASIATLIVGVSPAAFWDFAAIGKGIFGVFAVIPVYAIWALPTIGWLMLCSVWARRVPFLWAVIIPVLSGILVWMLDVMSIFGLGAGWFWSNIVGRLLGGTVLGIHSLYAMDAGILQKNSHSISMQEFTELFSVSSNYAALAMPGMWIGAAAGIAMIYASIRIRRWRDDS
jgi:ABC-2 type transport system permease protein